MMIVLNKKIPVISKVNCKEFVNCMKDKEKLAGKNPKRQKDYRIS